MEEGEEGGGAEEVSQLLQAMIVEIDHADRDALALSACDPTTPHATALPHVRLEELVGLVERTVHKYHSDDRNAIAVTRPIPTPVSLPIEIQRIILSSLTWSTIMRCRLVCRFWADAMVKWVALIPDGLRLNFIAWYDVLPPIPLARERCLFLARFERLRRLRLEIRPCDLVDFLPHFDNRFPYLEEVALDFTCVRDYNASMAPVMDRLRLFFDGLHAHTKGRFTSLSLNQLYTNYCLSCATAPPHAIDKDTCPEHAKDSHLFRLLRESSFGPHLKKLELRDLHHRWSWADSMGLSSLSTLTELKLVDNGFTGVSGCPKICTIPMLFAATLRVLIVSTNGKSGECLLRSMAVHGKVLEKLVLNITPPYIDSHPLNQDLIADMTGLQPLDAGLSKLVTFIYTGNGIEYLNMDMAIQVMRLSRDSLETLILHGPARWCSPELVDFSEMRCLRTISIEDYPALSKISPTVECIYCRFPGSVMTHETVLYHNGRRMLQTLPIHGLDRVELSLFAISAPKFILDDQGTWQPLARFISLIVSDGASVKHLVLRFTILTDDKSPVNELHTTAQSFQQVVARHLAWNPTTLLEHVTVAITIRDFAQRCLAFIPITFSAR